MPINNRTLDNGITLITEPVAATKAAAIGFWFYTGSRDEPPALSGATHFIEHMLFKGTGNMGARDIARFFDRTGGYVNAFTEREAVCLYSVVPGASAVEAMAVMIDMLTRSAFEDPDIETERAVIESEILSYLDDPEETCAEYFMEKGYAGSGLSQPIAGTVKSVSGIRNDELRSYYRDFFGKKLRCVTVTGAFDGAEIERAVGEYPIRGETGIAVADSPILWVPGDRVLRTKFAQSQLAVGWRIPRMAEPKDWFAWSLINDILSDTVSSRLFQELREDRGLCYSISGSVNAFRDAAFLGVSLSVPPDRTLEASDRLLESIRAFVGDGPTPSELEDAKGHETGGMLLSSEDPDYRMKRLARQFFFDSEVRSVEEDLSLVANLGLEDILKRLAGLRFDADRAFTLLAPGKYAKKWQKRRTR